MSWCFSLFFPSVDQLDQHQDVTTVKQKKMLSYCTDQQFYNTATFACYKNIWIQQVTECVTCHKLSIWTGYRCVRVSNNSWVLVRGESRSVRNNVSIAGATISLLVVFLPQRPASSTRGSPQNSIVSSRRLIVSLTKVYILPITENLLAEEAN